MSAANQRAGEDERLAVKEFGVKQLEQVLADWREDATRLRRLGHSTEADQIDLFVSEVAESAEEWLTFLTEDDACLRSGRSHDWFRKRFTQWETQRLAKRDGRVRKYRAVVVPQRPNLEAAYEQGRKDAA